MLLEQVWGEFNSRKPEHNVRVYVNTLRKKLKDDPSTTHKSPSSSMSQVLAIASLIFSSTQVKVRKKSHEHANHYGSNC
jgi:DNA-binding response OmpR family regulator